MTNTGDSPPIHAIILSVHHHRPMNTTSLFVAIFSDGYKRKVCSTSLDRAIAYAQDLESWFTSGGYNRILIDVQPAKV